MRCSAHPVRLLGVRRLRAAAATLAACALAAIWLGGCSMPSNPWRFAQPPTAGDTGRADPVRAPVTGKKIVVVGSFDDPSRAPNYSHGVGRAMGDAFSRVLMRDGRYEVRISERLAGQARRYAGFDLGLGGELTEDQREAREELRRDRGDVDYVVIGKVTDFYHTSDLPAEASRWGFFSRRSEAIVSFDLRVVDMQTMRVVGTDHLMGSANAGRRGSHELYENIALDAYVFWSTPLGRAGSRAIDRAVVAAGKMMPTRDVQHDRSGFDLAGTAASAGAGASEPTHRHTSRDQARADAGPSRFHRGQPQVMRVENSRRVTIMGGRNFGIERGERFHLAGHPGTDAASTTVKDPVTGRPIVIAITDVGETTSTGWLLGQKPRHLDLRGMTLHLRTAIERARVDPADAGEVR
jgi:hypothetical protein